MGSRVIDQEVKVSASPWSAISNIYRYDEALKEILEKGVRWKPGDGSKILFWEDMWCGDAA